jgi:TPR repeat protein
MRGIGAKSFRCNRGAFLFAGLIFLTSAVVPRAVDAQERISEEAIAKRVEELRAQLFRAETLLSEQRLNRPSASASRPEALPVLSGDAVTGVPEATVRSEIAQRATPQVQAMSRDQEQQLAKAEQLLRQGDIQGARLLLEYLLATGSPLVAFKLAETYDPKRLATWKAFGVRADPQKARELYQRAQAGGVKDAQERLSGLR